MLKWGAVAARTIRRVCVFLGSRPGARAIYREKAAELGREVARRGWELVYGGASVGVMGVIADAALEAGGQVIGVIPEQLVNKELAHPGLSSLRVVATMHERKALMASLADGFVALPGGFGTFDELFEIVTWAQLGIHDKPIGLLDTGGYFEPLARMVDHAVSEGFVPEDQRALLLRDASPAALLDAMERFEFPSLGIKWVELRDT